MKISKIFEIIGDSIDASENDVLHDFGPFKLRLKKFFGKFLPLSKRIPPATESEKT